MSATAPIRPQPQPRPQPEPEPDAPRLRLEWTDDGELLAWRGGDARAVRPVRCFPWSHPARHVSLRDLDGDEVALVDDPADLDAASRAALEAALAESGFVLRIERVVDVDEEIEIRTWRVVTREGARAFQTARDHWPRTLPGGGLLIRDVAGDLYHIADVDALDAASRRALWAFVDVKE